MSLLAIKILPWIAALCALDMLSNGVSTVLNCTGFEVLLLGLTFGIVNLLGISLILLLAYYFQLGITGLIAGLVIAIGMKVIILIACIFYSPTYFLTDVCFELDASEEQALLISM